MDSDRIKELQQATAYPSSVSVHKALLQVWNECAQENKILREDLSLEQDRNREILALSDLKIEILTKEKEELLEFINTEILDKFFLREILVNKAQELIKKITSK